MNNNDTTILLLVGGAILLIGLLLLLSPQPTTEAPLNLPASDPAVETIPPVPSVPSRAAPVVSAGFDRVVLERETFRLSGSAHDSGGSSLTYTWTSQDALGVFENRHSPTTAYTAPSSCACETRVVLTLTATNAHGAESSDQMVVTVRNPQACPVPTAIPPRCCPPTDPCAVDRETATCPATPDIACDSPCTIDAPAPPACPVPIPCPCTPDQDCTGTWLASWPVQQAPLHPRDRAKPAIDRQYPATIDEGTSLPLRASVHNPACQTVCFVWSVSKGWLEDADSLTPTFHAPLSDRRDGETATITLTLYDTSGGRSFDQIRVKIRNTDPQ